MLAASIRSTLASRAIRSVILTYLGYRAPVAANIGYLIASGARIDLAWLLFGSGLAVCAPERWLGWSPEQRERDLLSVTNNPHLLCLAFETNIWRAILCGKSLSGYPRTVSNATGIPCVCWKRSCCGRVRGAVLSGGQLAVRGQTTGRMRQNKSHRNNSVRAPMKGVYVYC